WRVRIFSGLVIPAERGRGGATARSGTRYVGAISAGGRRDLGRYRTAANAQGGSIRHATGKRQAARLRGNAGLRPAARAGSAANGDIGGQGRSPIRTDRARLRRRTGGRHFAPLTHEAGSQPGVVPAPR